MLFQLSAWYLYRHHDRKLFLHQYHLIKEHTSKGNTLDQILGAFILPVKYILLLFLKPAPVRHSSSSPFLLYSASEGNYYPASLPVIHFPLPGHPALTSQIPACAGQTPSCVGPWDSIQNTLSASPLPYTDQPAQLKYRPFRF